ncbi:restriction endonuclease subunit S [Ahrensia sp. 13_GOM-1096m]|uniref:restriction endonuclease subunit S n=1 Tax=Ahrensia sp. 13_GOM-1096m TaxID=1380380 RepID=UPI00068747EA|nr:restriction endonuclease subunit S [Ahrensia sp. 13_GOM-1096m]
MASAGQAKYRPYPAYKPSGVDWLGDIPEGWEAVPIKRIAKIENGATPKSGETAFWDGLIPWVTPADLGKSPSPYLARGKRNISEKGFASCGASLVPKGSVILSSRAPIGALGVSQCSLSTNQGCKSLIPLANLSTKYLYYFLSTNSEALNMLGRGSTFLELSSSDLGAFKIGLPQLSEQTKIAAFLDHETAKIDGLIAKQQRLIALLEEKRQAVISHAVTQGLDKSAPLRPSGIDWLGDVPAHWEVKRLKYLISDLESGVSVNASDQSANKNEIAVLKTSCVYTRSFRADENKTVVPEEIRRVKCPVRKNAIIISRMNTPELVGASAVVLDDSPNVFLPDRLWQTVYFDDKLQSSAFLAYFMMHRGFRSEISLAAEGASSSMQNIAKGDYLFIPVTLPPLNEQLQVVDWLVKKVGIISDLERNTQSAVDLLKERRTALISAAVTGKIDLRDWQLPEGIARNSKQGIDQNEEALA